MEFCDQFKTAHLNFDVNSHKVTLSRCCMKSSYVYAEYSVSDWEKIENKVEEINKYVNTWGLREGERDVLPWGCPKNVSTCFFDGNLARFERIEVGLDVSCNANCIWCGTKSDIQKVKEKGLTKVCKELYYNTLNNLIENISSPTKIRLTDHGEPLLWTKELLSFLEKVKNNMNVSLSITTNGLGLLNKDVSDALYELNDRVDIICSINALSEKRHYDIMKIHNFEKIILSLNKFSNVSLSYIIYDENDYKEFEDNIINFRKLTQHPIFIVPEFTENQQEKSKIAHKIINNFGKFFNNKNFIEYANLETF